MNIRNNIPVQSFSGINVKFKPNFMPKLSSFMYDTFVLSGEAKKKIDLFQEKKFGIDDYTKMTAVEKSFMDFRCPNEIKRAAADSVETALFMKNHLDEEYGEGNYVFCCIGTSPSGIARAFEFMGVETRYFPISDMSMCRDKSLMRLFSDRATKYARFFQEQGITQEKVEKGDKTYLFYDYTCSGNSLENFQVLVNEDCGIYGDNVLFKSINGELDRFCETDEEYEKYPFQYVREYMFHNKIEKLGGVPHLMLYQIDKILECVPSDSLEARQFNFCVMRNLQKRGILKENWKNRVAL